MGTFNLSSISDTIKAKDQAIGVLASIGLLRKINLVHFKFDGVQMKSSLIIC